MFDFCLTRLLSTEAFIQGLISKSSDFKKFLSDDAKSTENDAKAKLAAARFVAAQRVDESHAGTPPFVTTYGPSVFRCTCGVTFGDYKLELNEERLEAMKARRNAHFVKVRRGLIVQNIETSLFRQRQR
jgi:hypothetical protein